MEVEQLNLIAHEIQNKAEKTYQQQYQSLSAEHQSISQENHNYKQALDSLTFDISRSREEVHTLKAELLNRDRYLSEERDKVSRLTRTIESHQINLNELHAYQTEISRIKAIMGTKDIEISGWSEKYSELHQAYTELY